MTNSADPDELVSSENILAKTVNEFVINVLVKLMML